MNYIRTVSLPEFLDVRMLTVRGTVLAVSEWTGFEDMVLQNSGTYISDITKENIWKFVTCLVTFSFGLVLFLFGFLENI